MTLYAGIGGFPELTATIERRTVTVSNDGSPGGVFTSLAASVPAKFVELSGDEAIRYQRESNRYTAKLQFAHTQDVLTRDRIVFDGRTWEVITVTARRFSSGLVSHLDAIVEETQ